MSRAGKLIKEFSVKLIQSDEKIILRSILKDDFILTQNPNKTFIEKIIPGEYLLSMMERNSIQKLYQVEVSLDLNSITITNGFLKIHLSPAIITESLKYVNGWFSPFNDSNRKSAPILKKRIVDKFGVYRSSVQKGHKHAGIDIKGDWKENIFPIANGKVIFKSHWPNNSTIVIQHKLKNNKTLYSKYTHIKDLTVNIGQNVNINSRLGRLFTASEFKRTRYKHNHLHLEVMKSYNDKGRASSYSMTLNDLQKSCFNPLLFLENHFKK